MPNRYSNIKPCPVCGRKSWRAVVRTEPIDKTGLMTYEKKKTEYRVCKQCNYKERVETDND